HIVYGSCAELGWATGPQEGAVPACPGRTSSAEGGRGPTSVYDRDGNQVTVPDAIECGAGTLMQSVEYWAYAEGTLVLDRLPKFDKHDQELIEKAQRALVTIGGELGLTAANGSDTRFTPSSAADLTERVKVLIGEAGRDPNWYIEWTGLAAENFKLGFFASVAPTLTNQCQIAAHLHNLYAARGTIIQETRAGSLTIIEDAAAALDETHVVTTNLDPVWQTFQGLGTALSISGGWNPVSGAVGASVQLIGIIGAAFAPESRRTEYAHELEAVMAKIWEHLDRQADDLAERESDYLRGIHSLRDEVFDIHSFNLELYDLTENSATGSGDHGGFKVDIGTVLTLADTCFDCAQIYEQSLLPQFPAITAAEGSLTAEDGIDSEADIKVKEFLEEFFGYVQTACGRFYLAGEQLKAAAEAYAALDAETQAEFDRTMQDWDEPAAPKQARDWADDTDRTAWEDEVSGTGKIGFGTDPTAGYNDSADFGTALNG
ncbi:MAG: hypothetical protein HOQ43_09500, partial [Glycomyces artemisiae]|nr:hypothetical protein [Glycomyces artemisiae]